MKNFFWTVIILGIVLTLGADKMKKMMAGQTRWRLDYAVQQVNEAKEKYANTYADNDNALTSYNEATPAERLEMLIDLGALSDQTALCMADPGALTEAPTAHTPDELEIVKQQARRGLLAAN